MSEVFVVVGHFSDCNSHESSSCVVCATCSRDSAEKIVSRFKESSFGLRYEIVLSILYD